MSTTPASVVYAAAKTNLFQSPPYERPGGDEVLILRCYQDDEPTEVWRLPIVGEFDCPAELVPWTDGTVFARVDEKFTPPDLPGCDFEWMLRDFAVTCNGSIFHPNILPALRRFDGPILDQILARIEARADSNSTGDVSTMGTSNAELQRQIDVLKRQLGQPLSDQQRGDYAKAQAKANTVAQAYGDAAPGPLPGESEMDYRVRLATPYKKHSNAYKDSDLSKIRDMSAFTAVEDAIYNDAAKAMTKNEGPLRAVITSDASGRKITRYYGDADSCWSQFNPGPRYVTKILVPNR